MRRTLAALTTLLFLGCGAATPGLAPGDDAGALEVVDAGEPDVIEDAGTDDQDIPVDEDPGDPIDDEDGGDAGAIAPEDPDHPPVDDDEPDSVRITVATWNANYNNTVAAVVAHVRDDVDADVIGLQEMGSQQHARDIVDALTCPSCDYRAFQVFQDNAHACPILWKKAKFTLLASGHLRVNDPVDVNDNGSRDHLLAKSTVWVKLQEKTTGARFFLSNNHLVPSVEGADGQVRASASPERLALYREHMDGLVQTVDRANAQGLPVFVTGDFNVNYRRDHVTQAPLFPYARLAAKNVYANWKYLGVPAGQGTHGARVIDYVHVTRAPKKVLPLSQAILGPGGSDHDAVRVRFRLFAP